ncbi:VWA domain-containing protein [Colwellia sp. 1_MG-2023]|uniref:vWA domain-containing protein n=1 Tax=unclassified Colwellia TaxID=196834 RepID=UPI001C096E81|nr:MULTISPECIES: VWA domain-containing protein [unclassified Colwellia]MBU2924510.1 VWA domain-containing protein [Colwellia sp. C2M11]MDO6487621.1 VWA domain-containing protein [Colwellia sp. 6_MG-2023]MDO6652921.1 VWA domain-containing protein [Colwellia sp. 3_MG-2023]MDO6665403.1 VWA domain-containing protein [Colwellia sp. 2_MG-2023]MDO6689838.1 VWA domain-containing protein [Colwellia sp. 1_MG-2023]
MLIDFFCKVRDYKVPCTLRELLDLLRALEQGVVFASIDDFYSVSRTILVKDEAHFDKFDRAFADYFKGVASLELDLSEIPEEWLRKQFEKQLSDEEKAKIAALGGLDKLMETLAERLKEQEKRHQGGNKWIGTGGTSPFGAYGYNPEGVRIGQDSSRHRKATKVWDKRQFKNLDANVEIGTRNIKVALRKLRQFARTGSSEELALDDTIAATARNAGYLDIKMKPERHNAIKVLMFFDIGGSMDDHIKVCEQLFSAIHGEFKHLEFFYFHNCLYETVWRDNNRRQSEKIDLLQVLHTYSRDYKVIFVGDATMGPYEITYPGGSVEHWNEEAGSVWMKRLTDHFNKVIWLNPQPEPQWPYYASIQIMQQLVERKMYPLTLAGLGQGIKALT